MQNSDLKIILSHFKHTKAAGISIHGPGSQISSQLLTSRHGKVGLSKNHLPRLHRLTIARYLRRYQTSYRAENFDHHNCKRAHVLKSCTNQKILPENVNSTKTPQQESHEEPEMATYSRQMVSRHLLIKTCVGTTGSRLI